MTIKYTINSFDLKDIKVYDEYCSNAFEKEIEYLLSLDADRLLAGFRDNAGLDLKGAVRYDGWENMLIGGHTLGHYLTAVSQAIRCADAEEQVKTALKAKLEYICKSLLECQNNSKGKAGFVWGSSIIDRTNPEIQFDNLENSKTDFSQCWVPWYTMHKILAGLISAYKLGNCENAFIVADRLGDWVYDRVSGWNEVLRLKVLGTEYGGMNDALYELYRLTGKENHLKAAKAFEEKSLFDKIISGGDNLLDNLHANTTIPKFIGELNGFIAIENPSDYMYQAAEKFWELVVSRHSYVTGGNSEWEHFGKDYVLNAERTNCNCETCNVYNMLKLTKMLFMLTGDVKYAQFSENAFINDVLASQNPETGMTTYFQPMANGFFRTFSTPYTKFWCCTGSGMENFTKLGESFYYHNDNSLFVNMYLSSSVNWHDKSVEIEQKSGFPVNGISKFTVKAEKPAEFSFMFRIPDWCDGVVSVKINGTQSAYKVSDGYVKVSGTWKNGDEISVDIPMSVKAIGIPDADNVYAFKYGPVVLCADMGTENMATTETGVAVTIPKDSVENSGIIKRNNPASDITDCFVRSGYMRWKLKDTDCDYEFIPYYMAYNVRYGLYWTVE